MCQIPQVIPTAYKQTIRNRYKIIYHFLCIFLEVKHEMPKRDMIETTTRTNTGKPETTCNNFCRTMYICK